MTEPLLLLCCYNFELKDALKKCRPKLRTASLTQLIKRVHKINSFMHSHLTEMNYFDIKCLDKIQRKLIEFSRYTGFPIKAARLLKKTKVEISHYITFLIITELIRNILNFWETLYFKILEKAQYLMSILSIYLSIFNRNSLSILTISISYHI